MVYNNIGAYGIGKECVYKEWQGLKELNSSFIVGTQELILKTEKSEQKHKHVKDSPDRTT